MERLRSNLKALGTKLPKKHGEWYRLHIYDDHYLVYDTWNGQVYHHKECTPSDTDNMYRVVYVFSGMVGAVEENMCNFWNAHIQMHVSC